MSKIFDHDRRLKFVWRYVWRFSPSRRLANFRFDYYVSQPFRLAHVGHSMGFRLRVNKLRSGVGISKYGLVLLPSDSGIKNQCSISTTLSLVTELGELDRLFQTKNNALQLAEQSNSLLENGEDNSALDEFINVAIALQCDAVIEIGILRDGK